MWRRRSVSKQGKRAVWSSVRDGSLNSSVVLDEQRQVCSSSPRWSAVVWLSSASVVGSGDSNGGERWVMGRDERRVSGGAQRAPSRLVDDR
ncbi:hypothetical protein Dimus_026860 [Dionaea muscipula]